MMALDRDKLLWSVTQKCGLSIPVGILWKYYEL